MGQLYNNAFGQQFQPSSSVGTGSIGDPLGINGYKNLGFKGQTVEITGFRPGSVRGGGTYDFKCLS